MDINFLQSYWTEHRRKTCSLCLSLRTVHLRRLCSERESLLEQRDSMACTVNCTSVPSSSYLERQSFTKRTEIHSVPQCIGKPCPLELVLTTQDTRHITQILSRKFAKSHRVASSLVQHFRSCCERQGWRTLSYPPGRTAHDPRASVGK